MPWEKQFGVVEVLDSAMQAFWVHGYEATSVQDLVERTGVNRASLYATYGDKHDLFLAALRHYRETRLHLFVTELELRYSPVDAVRRLFQAFVDQVAVQGLNQGCFLANTALELAAHDPEAAAIVADAQKEMEAVLFHAILKANPSAANPEATAQCLLATLIGLVVLSRSRPDPALLQTIADQALSRMA